MSNRSLVNRFQTMISAVRQSPLRALFLAVAVALCGLMTVADLPSPSPVHAQEQAVTPTKESTGAASPERPTDLEASASHDSVSLTWTASTDDTVTHYAVLRRDRNADASGVFKVIDSNAGPETSYTDDSVSPKGSYVYRVKAVNTTGVSQWSSYARADTPPDPADLAPGSLSAKAVSDDDGVIEGVALAWDAPAEDAASVTGYEILRAVGDGELATLVSDTGSTGATYTDDTATEAGESYAYRVKALRGEEASQPSDQALAIIPKVTAVEPEPGIAERQTTTEVWSATLTVKDAEGGDLGCHNSVATAPCSNSLTDTTFSYDNASYTVQFLFLRPSGTLEFNVTTNTTDKTAADLVLNIDGTAFALSDAFVSGPDISWSNSGLSWTIGDSVTVTLTTEVWSATLPVKDAEDGDRGCHNGVVDSTARCSNSLTDDTFEYDNTSYSVTRLFLRPEGLNQRDLFLALNTTPTAGTIADLTLNVGGSPFPLSEASLTGSSFTWANSGLTWAIGDDVSVSLTGEEPDPEAAPTVSSVVVTSDPGADETYAIGDTIQVTVTFGAAVTVTGKPRIQLRIGGGDPEHRKWADYKSGSGSEALVFAYTVRYGDTDPNGIYIAENELFLNGGTIQSSGGTDAVLDYPQPGTQSGHKVDTGVPTLTKEQIWSATLMVGESDTWLGFDVTIADRSSLSDRTITFDGVTYQINTLAFDKGTSRLAIGISDFSPRVPQAFVNHWTLVVGGAEYSFANAWTPSGFLQNRQFRWTIPIPGLSWAVGDDVSVSVKAFPNVDASGVVVISGRPFAGQTLTADASGIVDPNGVPNRFSHQWKAGDADIPGATGSTYVPVPADIGKTIKVVISFTDDNGYKESLTSEATAAVGNRVREVWAAQMTVGTGPQGQLGYGNNYTGDSLTDNTFTTSAGDHTVRNVRIQRAQLTETRFTVTGSLPEVAEENWVLYLDNLRFNLGDASKQTPQTVTAFSWSQPVPSWQSGDEVDVALLEVNLTAGGAPVIRGAPRVGDALTVDTSGITDGNGIPEDVVFSYQWYLATGDGDTEIPGATGASFPLDHTHLNRNYLARVSFTDAAGFEESLVTDPTSAVGERAHKFWTATVTVKQGVTGLNSIGYHFVDGFYPGDGITEGNVTFGASSYVVRSVSLTPDGVLDFDLSPRPSDEEIDLWILDTPLRELPLADATLDFREVGGEPVAAFNWNFQRDQAWSDGDMIQLSLKVLNSPARGRPVIAGDPALGSTLTADTSGITDPDGVPDDAVFTYQWLSSDGDDDVEIDGATGPSYLITGNEPSNFLRVRVGFTDGRDFEETVTSNAAVWPQLGELWTAGLTVGQHTNDSDSIGYGSFYEGSFLSATAFTLDGQDYSVKVVALSRSGLKIEIEPPLSSEEVANRLILGVGSKEFRFSDRSTTFSYLSLNDSFSLVVWEDPDLSWSQGEAVRLALKEANQSAGGAPVIRGAPRVDDVLTADTSGITDANGVPEDAVFSYQWFNGATNQDIPGATGASLPLDSSHLGLTIGVRVGFTDAHGYQESVTSGVTAPVAERAHKFWTATLTATGSPGLTVLPIVGYPAPFFPDSSLTDATVTYGSKTYTVESVQLTGTDETSLSVRFSRAPTEGEVETWILDVDGREYFPSESTTPADSEPDRTFLWEDSGLSWSDGEVVSLALKVLNRPAQGAAIAGDPGPGATLTADTSGITDPEGVPGDAVFTYQWFSVESGVVRDIDGATGPSYIIPQDRDGQLLGLRVGFTDGRGFHETVTSSPVAWPQLGELWVAALTVGRNAALDRYGFGEDYEGGALPDATFSHAGKNYTFSGVSIDSEDLQLLLEPELTEVDADLLDFYLWAHPFQFSGRSGSESSLNLNDSGRALIVWTEAALIWSQGDVIRLALKAANQSAGGAPVIRGALRVDDVLTADASGITDANGVPEDAVFSYQWFNGATNQDITGATGASLPLESSHLGLTIGVRVGFTDAHGYQETVTSGVTAPVAERAHKFWTATLTATRSSGLTVVPIVGYPAPFFPDSSLTRATVTYGPNTYSVESVQLTGSDETSLSVRFSQAPAEGEVETWILDVNGREYLPSESTTPADSEPDRTFLWENSGLSWSDGEVVSLALKVLNQPAQGRPGISGTRKFGETLTADTSGITDPNFIPAGAFTYQWFTVDLGGDETDISDATGPSYTIQGDLEDDFLGVRVGFTDSHGFHESVASEEVVWRKAGEIWEALLTVGYSSGPNQHGFGHTYEGGTLSDTGFRYFNRNFAIQRISLTSRSRELNLLSNGVLSEEEAGVLTFRVGSGEFAFTSRASQSLLDTNRQLTVYWLDTGLSWSKGDKVRVALSVANQDHSGTLALLGQPKVGRLLWADPSGFTDPNGVPDDVVFVYQWVRCAGTPLSCDDISGADGPSYRLREADENSRVGVRVSFHDTLGYLEEKSSTVVGPVEAGSQAVDFWTATVTVTSHPDESGAYGYHLTSYPGSALTEPVVTFGSANYSVDLIQLVRSEDTGQTHLILRFNEELPDDARDAWLFEVAGREFSLSQASDSLTFPGKSFQFHDSGLSWSDGDMIQLSLKAPNSPARGVAITGEPSPVNTLTADTSGLTDPDGIPDDAVLSYQWIDSDGDNDADIDGATQDTYTVTGNEGGLVKVRVGFTDARGFSESVTSEGVVTPKRGEVLWALLRVAQHTNDPDQIGHGSFYEGSFLSESAFTLAGQDYSVRAVYLGSLIIQIEPQLSSEEVANRLTLRVGSREFPFSDRSTTSSNLSLNDSFSHVVWKDPDLSWSAGDKIRIGLSATTDAQDEAPEVRVINASDGTYGINQTLSVTVVFSAAVTVTGTPQLALDIGGETRQADYASGSGTQSLLFSYTVAVGDEDTDGIEVPSDSLTLNGGAITAGGLAAVLLYPNYTFSAVLVDGSLTTTDTTPPALESATVSEDGTIITLVFDEAFEQNAAFGLATTDFSVTAGGSTVTIGQLGLFADAGIIVVYRTIQLKNLSPAITHGQTVTVSYTDPPGDNGYSVDPDVGVIEDAAGNDVATFTTGLGSVPAVVNNVPAAGCGTLPTGRLWSACLTVGSRTAGGLTFLGWDDTPNFAGASLSDEEFDYGGDTYNLRAIDFQGGGLTVAFNDTGAGDIATQATRDKLTLHVGTDTFNMGDGDLNVAQTGVSWIGSGLTWADGDTVALSISVPNTAPAFSEDRTMREVAENSAGDVAVGLPVTASDADNDTLTYSLEGTDAASFQIDSASGQIRTASGVTYDHETKPSYTVTVKAEDGNGGSDTIAVTINLIDVDETPAVASVVVTSTPTATADTYGRDETIEVTVTFDQAVTVTGTPRIQLRIGGGGAANLKWADYASGSGNEALVFAYVVQAGDMDDNGIYIEADELFLNGGTIQGVDDDVAAGLTYALLGTQSGHKVDGSLTTTGATNAAPVFTSADTFSAAENQTAVGTVMATDADAGDTVSYAVTGGDDQARFQINPTSGVLTFAAEPDHENPTDADRNNTYLVTVTATGGAGGRALTTDQAITVTVNDVDETPAVASVDVTSTPTATADTYGLDETIEVTVTFDQAVTVTGTPRIQLRIGGGAQENLKWANYASGSGNEALVFAYTVQAGDMDDNGIYIEANELFLNGGTIQGVDDDVAATLTYTRPGTQSGHKVDGSLTTTGATNAAPVFTSDATFSADENQTSVGTVIATDADAGDTVSYAVTGGDDETHFQIDPASGVLTFATAPDHENPADAGTNNVYLVTVTATGGTGGRALTTDQAITVTVNDVDDTAGTPAMDDLTATVGTGKIRLEWTGSADAYEYRRKEEGRAWSAWTAAGTGGWFVLRNATTLDDYDVLAETTYTYQVREAGASDALGEAQGRLGPPITLRLDRTAYSVDEGAGELFFTVLAEAPAGWDRYDRDIRPSFTSAGVPGPLPERPSERPFSKTQEDYELLAESLRIEPGDFVLENGRYVASRGRSIGIVDDTLVEGDETFELRLLLAGGVSRFFTLGVGNGRAEVTIVDNDTDSAPAAGNPLTGFELVDATAHLEAGAVEDGATLTDIDPDKVYGFRANVEPGSDLQSVKLELRGPGENDIATRTANDKPYSLYGDSGGHEHGATLAPGSYTLTATAHSEPGGGGSQLGTLSVEFTVAGEPLTVKFEGLPRGGHAGAGTTFTVRLSFSEAVSITHDALGQALEVTNATVGAVSRVDDRGDLWEVRLTPESDATVTVALSPAADCDAAGAVCTADGRMLAIGAGTAIPGPPPNSPATGAPTIGGIADVGEVLSADVAGIDDDNGLENAAFSYQWLKSDGDAYTNIQGATGSTYTLVADDEGRTIKVKVSFTDDEGNAESLTSDPTGEVEAAETVPGRPQDLEGEASAQGIELTWEAPAGSAVTHYVVYRAVLDNGQLHGKPMTRYATIDATGADMAYIDADAEAGVEYRYRVAAVNSAGEGKKSTWINIFAEDS